MYDMNIDAIVEGGGFSVWTQQYPFWVVIFICSVINAPQDSLRLANYIESSSIRPVVLTVRSHLIL